MRDLQAILADIHRPRLLIRAARFGMLDYHRNRDLKRLIGSAVLPKPRHAVSSLITEEARLDQARKTGDAAYRVTLHVEVLIALMAEAQSLNAAQQSV